MPAVDRQLSHSCAALRWEPTDEGRQSLVWKEWLVTNGLGGYASGTVAGAMTRRYHGLLIAALSTPVRTHDDVQPPLGDAAMAGRPCRAAS